MAQSSSVGPGRDLPNGKKVSFLPHPYLFLLREAARELSGDCGEYLTWKTLTVSPASFFEQPYIANFFYCKQVIM